FKNAAVFIITLFIGILLLYATFSGWENYKSQNETSEKYQHESREDWLKNPDKNPHRMAHYGNFAFRKSTPLSVFEFGMEPFFG
ncbi:ABC transporter permease, partial [Flavobacterium sp. 3-210]